MANTNADWTHRAAKVLSGPQSNLAPAMPIAPIFAQRAAGHRIFDVEGRDYIDLALTMGPLIFGHGHPQWISAVEAQLRTLPSPLPGQFYSPLEVELGERMISAIPCAELVKYGLSGSEVVQLVFRLARAFTSRPYVLRFDGHYHGWMDEGVVGFANPMDRWGDDENPARTHPSKGVIPEVLDQFVVARWNDPEHLRRRVDEFRGKIAAIIFEPALCNTCCIEPVPGLMATIRELCDRDGMLSVSAGWHTHLAVLRAELEGRKMPGFWRTFARLHAEYDKRLG